MEVIFVFVFVRFFIYLLSYIALYNLDLLKII